MTTDKQTPSLHHLVLKVEDGYARWGECEPDHPRAEQVWIVERAS